METLLNDFNLQNYDATISLSCDKICSKCKHQNKCMEYFLTHDPKLVKIGKQFNEKFFNNPDNIVDYVEKNNLKFTKNSLFESKEEFDEMWDITEKAVNQYKDHEMLAQVNELLLCSRQWFIDIDPIMNSRKELLNKQFQERKITRKFISAEFEVVNSSIDTINDFFDSVKKQVEDVLFNFYAEYDDSPKILQQSAKALLQGIKKVKAAWNTIIANFNLDEDKKPIKALELINKISEGVIKLAPQAEKTKLKGFDDAALPNNN